MKKHGGLSMLDGNDAGRVADAIAGVGISPNESDRNHDPANLVDGLFAIARAIEHVADELRIRNTST